MKVIYLLFISSCFFVACGPKSEKETVKKTVDTDHPVDTAFSYLSKIDFGADDYGMKKYVMAFLKMGPNRLEDKEKAMELQNAHLKNIGRLAKEGKLVLAGPFFGNDSLRGIYIFNVSSVEEAEALTNTDPAIQAGSLVMELKEWYGSAALMAVNPIHDRLAKKSVVEE